MKAKKEEGEANRVSLELKNFLIGEAARTIGQSTHAFTCPFITTLGSRLRSL